MAVFRDHDGNHFDIPDEQLQQFKVKGDLADDAKIGGVQTDASGASAQRQQFDPGAPKYLWPPIELLHNVVANIVANIQQRPQQPNAYNYGGSGGGIGTSAALDPRVYNWAPGEGPTTPRPYNYQGPSAPSYNYIDPRIYNWAPDVFTGGGRFGGR